MMWNKNNFYRHVFCQFFTILFGNVINGFSVFHLATLYYRRNNYFTKLERPIQSATLFTSWNVNFCKTRSFTATIDRFFCLSLQLTDPSPQNVSAIFSLSQPTASARLVEETRRIYIEIYAVSNADNRKGIDGARRRPDAHGRINFRSSLTWLELDSNHSRRNASSWSLIKRSSYRKRSERLERKLSKLFQYLSLFLYFSLSLSLYAQTGHDYTSVCTNRVNCDAKWSVTWTCFTGQVSCNL